MTAAEKAVPLTVMSTRSKTGAVSAVVMTSFSVMANNRTNPSHITMICTVSDRRDWYRSVSLMSSDEDVRRFESGSCVLNNGRMSSYKVVDTQFELRRDVVSLVQIVHAPIKQPTGEVKTFIVSANISRHSVSEGQRC